MTVTNPKVSTFAWHTKLGTKPTLQKSLLAHTRDTPCHSAGENTNYGILKLIVTPAMNGNAD